MFAQIHPATAARLAIVDGGMLELTNGRGTVRCRARLSTDIRHDTVFVPFHYAGDASANLLTQDATDPISGMPDFKTAAVTVRAVAEVVL
jgi:assimilatory nitrate reductase catalytic subunit